MKKKINTKLPLIAKIKIRPSFLSIFIGILTYLNLLNFTYAAELKSSLSLQGDTLNFKLSGQNNWDYDLKKLTDKGQSKVQLYVKNTDQNFIQNIKQLENPFVKSIQVTPKSIDGKTLIEFTLKNNQVETFDYLTDRPSDLIIDFYASESTSGESEVQAALQEDNKQSGKPVKNDLAVSDKNLKNNLAKIKKISQKNKNSKSQRSPADVDILRIESPGGIETSIISRSGLYDGGDAEFSRFTMRESDYKEEAVIKAQNNYYLKFPILESEFSFWKKMKENPPVYDFKVEETEENQQARLIKTLFDKKRFLVFRETAEWFKKKYPHSAYLETISYMMGDALLDLWKQEKNDAIYEQAIAAYTEAIKNYPDSILAERTSLLLGMLAVDKLDYMSAIRRLNLHIENPKYQNKLSQQYAKIGMAYSFSKINKLDEALNLLSRLQKESHDPLVQADAAVRKGDFNFQSKKYPEAVEAYNQALKKFDFVSTLFPSAYFNKMEAQFWTKQYKDSHQSALSFARNYPNHEFAPYALTRVGELLDIMGADQAKSVGAYLETHFRYGDSPKTIIARLHMLSTRMKSMKSEELQETLKKMDTLAEKSELENVDQFKIAMVSDGFARRKDYKKAIEILSAFYQQNPLRPDSKQVTHRIVRNINDELKNLVDQEKYKELLKTYKEYADTWLKAQSRIDTDYLLGLAYQNAGAYQAADDKFKSTIQKMLSIQGTQKEKEVSVNEYLPSLDSLYLRVAQNSYDNKSYQDSYRSLEKVKNPIELSDAEQVQRVILASQLYEQKADYDSSERYLTELVKLWKGDENLELPALVRLSGLQTQRQQFANAIVNYEKSFDIIMSQEKPDAATLKKIAQEYTQVLVKMNKAPDAISMLNKAVQKFGEQLPMTEEKYLLGDLYFKNGEIKNAERSWGLIKEDSKGIWKKLAQEKLQQANWDENYKKHIKRIPAMSQMEEAKP